MIARPSSATVRNHAADQLLELIADDCFALLVEACHDSRVRDAVAHLLGVLVEARDRRHGIYLGVG